MQARNAQMERSCRQSTKNEMRYKEQFVFFKGAFSEDARYYNKFLRHRTPIVDWCNVRNIKPKAFCAIAVSILEYFDDHGIQSATFARKGQEEKSVLFEEIARNGGWEALLVQDVYNQIHDTNGSQIFN
eukprot:NODE_311_length_11244_cov_0.423419.p8 type:complete len:129 gc:universal NODE_311_length_11244_cov_0.423419:4604-4990(+)